MAEETENHQRGPTARAESATRLQLLNAAGEIFAAKGFDRATSREICDRAGVNPAAVNYHFGGVDGLYSAALVLAHSHLMQLETLSLIALGDGTAAHKLSRIVEVMIGSLANTDAGAWQVRLIGRELVTPSHLRERLVETQILPKLRIVRSLVGEVIGLPEDHPAVGRSVLSIVAPCLLLAIGDSRVLTMLVPSLAEGTQEAAPMAEHLIRFDLAGLAAVADAIASSHRHG